MGSVLDGRRSTLAVLSLGSVGLITARYVVPSFLPTIIDDLAITPSLAGFVLTVGWASFALFQYPAGRIADYLTAPTVVVVGLALGLVGSTAMLFVTTYPVFVLAVLALGMGAGFYFPGMYVMSVETFPENTGSVFGVISASINVGGTVAPGLAVVALAVAVWQSAFLPVSLLLVLVVVLFHRRTGGAYALSGMSLEVKGTLRRLFGDESIRWTLLAAALLAFVWQGYTSFLPTFLQAAKGFPPHLANGAFASVFVLGILVNPVTGRLADLRGHFEIIVGMALLGGVGLGLLVAGPSRPVVLAGVACSAFGFVGIWPAVNAHFISRFPDRSYGGDFGAVRTLFLGFGSVGSTFVGTVAETAGYELAFGGLLAVLAVSVAIWASRAGLLPVPGGYSTS